MSISHNRFGKVFFAGGVTLAVATAPLVIQAPLASSATCGYSVHNEDVSSDASLNLPIFGEVDPFGGKREFGYWGNCGDGNEEIVVHAANGDERKCVTPGETKLGQTRNEKKVSGAERVGDC